MTGYALLFLNYIFLLFTFIHAAPSKGCKINTKNDLPKKHEPIFLIKDNIKYDFALPEILDGEGFIELKYGQEMVLACTGNNNIMNETQEDLNYAECKTGNRLIINGATYDSVLLECRKTSAASIKKIDKKCFDGKGFILEIGYSIKGWHPMISVCHNILQGETYYSIHTLYGSKRDAKVLRKSRRPGFIRGEKYLFDGFKPDETYSRDNQLRIFHDKFGKDKTDEYLNASNAFLSRGHLAPDADFLFSAWQLATYFYINVAPQWQTINGGYWLSIENISRKIASQLGVNLQVVTGTHDILKLADDKGKVHKIYLESNKRVQVPEYFWKILRNPDNNSCIGFIITNNPYLKTAPKHKCKDICEKFGWPKYQRELNKGYTYCCDYDGMRAALPEVPVLRCKTTLKFV